MTPSPSTRDSTLNDGKPEFADLFDAMGALAKFFGIDPAEFFTPDEPPKE